MATLGLTPLQADTISRIIHQYLDDDDVSIHQRSKHGTVTIEVGPLVLKVDKLGDEIEGQ